MARRTEKRRIKKSGEETEKEPNYMSQCSILFSPPQTLIKALYITGKYDKPDKTDVGR